MPEIKLTAIAFHRNGSFGEAFYVVTFKHQRERKTHPMAAIVFETQDMPTGEVHPCTGRVAILDAEMAAQGIVERGVNFWRGDDFEPQLRQWIAQWQAAQQAEKLTAELGVSMQPHRSG